MVKVTTTQKQFVAGTIYLYSERIHKLEFENGNIIKTDKDLRTLKAIFRTPFEQEMKVKKVQVTEAV